MLRNRLLFTHQRFSISLIRLSDCTKAEEIHNQILAERVYELKETQGGIEFMCKEIEQIARLVKVSEKDVRKWLEESLSLA